MESALAKARQIVDEMKGTVWTSTGMRPDGARTGAMWDNVEDHEGFVLAGSLTTGAAKHPLRYQWELELQRALPSEKGGSHTRAVPTHPGNH